MKAVEKILKITTMFGMKYHVAAKAINISINSFYKKVNEKYPDYDFEEKDVQKLKDFIAEKAKETKLY